MFYFFSSVQILKVIPVVFDRSFTPTSMVFSVLSALYWYARRRAHKGLFQYATCKDRVNNIIFYSGRVLERVITCYFGRDILTPGNLLVLEINTTP